MIVQQWRQGGAKNVSGVVIKCTVLLVRYCENVENKTNSFSNCSLFVSMHDTGDVNFCDNCFGWAHQGGSLALHECQMFVPGSQTCAECEKRVAVKECNQCGRFLLVLLCFELLCFELLCFELLSFEFLSFELLGLTSSFLSRNALFSQVTHFVTAVTICNIAVVLKNVILLKKLK